MKFPRRKFLHLAAGAAALPGGDAGISAPEPRLRSGSAGCQQTGEAVSHGRLQPLRGDGTARQSLQPVWAVLEQMKLQPT